MSEICTQRETKLPASGGFPYILAKTASLHARGLLRPDVWSAVNSIARARGAAVEQTRTLTGQPAMTISWRGVVVVVVRERRTRELAVLTAFAPRWGRFERVGHVFLDAARGVKDLVDLEDRWEGRA